MEEKLCIECNSILPEGYDQDKCKNCLDKETSRKKSKNFWEEVEKNQTTIEDFGYTVKTEIRKSENCVVYMATTPENKTVTIKKISIPLKDNDETQTIKDKIASEIDQLSKISNGADNRFIITYYDYKIESNEDKYDLYIKMEYLTSLSRFYKDNKISVRSILSLGLDICEALEWCHNNGRVHNNINIENIFVNDSGKFLLGDFSLSYVGQNEERICIAPENVNGEKPSNMSDIYALGMVMYLLLNDRKKPFDDGTVSNETAEEKRLSGAELPFKNSISNRLKDVIIRATSVKSNRYSSVSEFKNEIKHLLDEMPKEWLDCDVGESATIDNEREKKEKKDKKDKNKALKNDLKEFEQKVELSPEEKEKKEREKKDFIVIGGIVVLIVAIVVSVVLIFNNTNNRKIYSLIDSGSYAVAFKEIDTVHSKGENVDELLKTYIDACMNDYEYKRVVQAIQIFSDDAFTDVNYFKDIIERIIGSNKNKQADEIIRFLSGKNSNMDSMLEQIIEKNK